MLSRCRDGRLCGSVHVGFHWISGEIFDILPKLGTKKHQGKTKTKFKPGDLDLIFEVTELILRRWHVKVGFHSIYEVIFYVSSPKLVHRSTRARQRPLLNWVTLTLFLRSQSLRGHLSQRAIKDGFHLISEEIFVYPHQVWYTEAPEQGRDLDWTLWPWAYFQGHEGRLSLFKMVST